MSTVLKIDGMMCKHCKAHVEKALTGMEGVTKVEVSLEDKQAVVEASREISMEEFAAVIKEAGYQVVI